MVISLRKEWSQKLNPPCESENVRPCCCSSITVDVSGEVKKSERIMQDDLLGRESDSPML
jgi:hypothetical protein